MKENKERLTYTFKVTGHPAILATHVKTLEFTKDSDLTERGDCIIGINADFELEKLKQFSKKVKIICKIDDLESEFKATVNPNFNSDHELVLRKSLFNSDRTFGFNLNRGANHLDREIVEMLKEGREMEVRILEGWF